MKPTCFKKYLHRRQGQSGFHFLIFILNDEREVQKEEDSYLEDGFWIKEWLVNNIDYIKQKI